MRTIVISGASSGIGRATAERFAAAGDHVVNLDVKAPDPGGEPAGTWTEVDVADWTAVQEAVAGAHRETGRLDVVIANAGISTRHGVLDMRESDVRRLVEVNLFGVLALWQQAARIMVEQGHGTLLATASVNGTRGYPHYADYNASKAGILALVRTFALELSPRVRAACVSPGAVLTPMQLAEYTDEMLKETNAQIPAGRHADPSEIASAFHYLASDEAAFLTGQELIIDGGETVGATTSAYGTAVRSGR
ncbi:SDR family NAD(P)-dependent oxidoreductase [Streptomyces kanamyceticus]|uniref:SDR family oxidoreductase n=1 Tax=Streptomyces kanamyceticus TaxID=1967 RepID=A0A5J6GPM0_STRKN|nr:SDR family oxidoreductase [Streptomyces kanamyceticus]QEU96362.1 SDR family oxidoreductase [Streptomyces kanamyceticus]